MTKVANRAEPKGQIARSVRARPSAQGVETVGGQIQVEMTTPGLKEVGGSTLAGFNFWILKAALNVRSETSWMKDADKSQQVSAIVQALRGFAPMDEIEGMMASQAVVRIPGSCRPRFREIVAHRSELKSPGIPI